MWPSAYELERKPDLLPFNPTWANGRRIVIDFVKKNVKEIAGQRSGKEKMKSEETKLTMSKYERQIIKLKEVLYSKHSFPKERVPVKSIEIFTAAGEDQDERKIAKHSNNRNDEKK